jgi:hypothetical protein
MKRPLLLLPLLLAVSGCGIGSSDASPPENQPDWVATETCLKEKEIDARMVDERRIQVGEEGSGPRIDFYLTPGEAEARQFAGEAEGTEQIGSALLWVNEGGEDLLFEIEDCLDDL